MVLPSCVLVNSVTKSTSCCICCRWVSAVHSLSKANKVECLGLTPEAITQPCPDHVLFVQYLATAKNNININHLPLNIWCWNIYGYCLYLWLNSLFLNLQIIPTLNFYNLTSLQTRAVGSLYLHQSHELWRMKVTYLTCQSLKAWKYYYLCGHLLYASLERLCFWIFFHSCQPCRWTWRLLYRLLYVAQNCAYSWKKEKWSKRGDSLSVELIGVKWSF